jgi:hypothetical protein
MRTSENSNSFWVMDMWVNAAGVLPSHTAWLAPLLAKSRFLDIVHIRRHPPQSSEMRTWIGIHTTCLKVLKLKCVDRSILGTDIHDTLTDDGTSLDGSLRLILPDQRAIGDP